MAEIERVSDADRMEQAGLERAIADIERAALSSPPGTRPFFNGALLNARARLGVLEKKIHDEEREKQQHATNEGAIIELAQKETGLNAKEKETYSGFLKEDFFTKKDFAKLDEFYAHSWERLSQGGKDQMSHRIWEGVRREEYKFTDLPKSVQEKEAKQAYKRLTESTIGTGDARQIPEKDRQDFLRAYEAGKRDEAEKVLERDSFKKSMFRDSDSKGVKSAQVQAGREAEAKAAGAQVVAGGASEKSVQPVQNAGKAKESLADLNLDGLKLADASSPPSSASIPRGAPARAVPSLGGS
jgi:hypothetical protein